MKFSELPIDTQKRLNDERSRLSNQIINNAYEVLLYNKAGTRFFSARRQSYSWQDEKGNYMPFGGGSEWIIRYGCIGFVRRKQVIGYDYELCKGQLFGKSSNGTTIPKSVKTKKDVLNIAKSIGIFNEEMNGEQIIA